MGSRFLLKKPDSQNIGNTGEYYMASILSAHGFTTTITLGRAEKYDLIAISPKGRTVKIQVKTEWKKTRDWLLSKGYENIKDDNFYFAFVRLNLMTEKPDFWMIPSTFLSSYIKRRHKKWLATPGKKGQKHNDNPGRTFNLKRDKYTVSGWSEESLNKWYLNIHQLK